MKKLVFFASAFSLLLFTGCSSDDNDATGGGTGGTSTEITTSTGSSGLQQIPVNVAAGTTEVTVKYTVDGVEQEVSVPFTQTSSAAGSDVVSGYATLYSANPATVDVYSGGNLLAENVQMTGRNVTYAGGTTIQQPADDLTKEDAYAFLHYDTSSDPSVAVPSDDYYPINSKTGGPYFGVSNMAAVLVAGTDSLWQRRANGNRYLYSSDGSVTAKVIASLKDAVKSIPVNGKRFDPDTQTIIWYLVQYVDALWHIEGVITDKAKTTVSLAGTSDEGLVDATTPSLPQTPDVKPGTTTTYYAGGVMMYDADNDKDYNDLVVDYDVEAVFPASEAQSPYVRVVMHLRALSNKSIDKVSIELSGMEQYVCPTDDMYITFHGINVDKTPAFSENGAYMIPDFRACELTPGTNGNTNAEVSNLQWILTNGKADWFDVDANGYYNVTQKDFNDKDFATVEIVYYPNKEVANVEDEVAKIIDVVSQNFKFDGADGDYIIAPVGTPHVMEGYKITDAFPLYGTPGEDWWNHSYAERVVDINRGYAELD